MAKNTYGTALTVTIFGESHGAGVGVVIDGMTPGVPVDPAQIDHQLMLRRPAGSCSTARRERDAWQLISGVFEGKTTGTPICILIPNEDTQSADYPRGMLRPGHADYTAACKYHGAQDHRGGGHFSGRVTAGLVAAGGILIPALRQLGIELGTHLARLGDVEDDAPDVVCAQGEERLRQQLRLLGERTFPTLCEQRGAQMLSVIAAAREQGDSVGGVLETVIVGLPAGLGEPWFDSMESQLAHGLFSIPGVKGVEFGAGFGISQLRGSEANDALCLRGERIVTQTNHNGGINGGITNGMPVVFRCAVKPTPSIAREQRTVDVERGTASGIRVGGRHDPCIAHRARVVVDSVAAIAVADALLQRYGNDALLRCERTLRAETEDA